jgi:hypothetical protein
LPGHGKYEPLRFLSIECISMKSIYIYAAGAGMLAQRLLSAPSRYKKKLRFIAEQVHIHLAHRHRAAAAGGEVLCLRQHSSSAHVQQTAPRRRSLCRYILPCTAVPGSSKKTKVHFSPPRYCLPKRIA